MFDGRTLYVVAETGNPSCMYTMKTAILVDEHPTLMGKTVVFVCQMPACSTIKSWFWPLNNFDCLDFHVELTTQFFRWIEGNIKLQETILFTPAEIQPKQISLPKQTKKNKVTSQLRPRCFWWFINRPSLIFDNPYRISTLCIKQHHSFSLVFAWLWVRYSWILGTFRNNSLHTRLEKRWLFFHLSSSRPVRPVSSTCSHMNVNILTPPHPPPRVCVASTASATSHER